MFLERVVVFFPAAHVLATTVATHVVVCALVGEVVEACQGEVFGQGSVMGPAKFEFGGDFDRAGECLCAVLDYVHFGGWGASRFAGFGDHPCDEDGGGGIFLSLSLPFELRREVVMVLVVGGEV